MSLRRADETNGRGQSRNGVTGHRGNVGAAISDGDRLLEVLRVGLEQKLSVSQGDSVGVKPGGVEDPQKPKREKEMGHTARMKNGVKWANAIAKGYQSSHKATTTATNQPPKVIGKGPSLEDRIGRLAGTLEPEEERKLLKCVRNLNKWQGECTRLVEQYEAKRPGLETAGAANNNLNTDDVLKLWNEDDFKQADSLLTKKQELELTAMTHSDRAGASDGGASGSKTPGDMLSSWDFEKAIKRRDSSFPNLLKDWTGDDDELIGRFL